MRSRPDYPLPLDARGGAGVALSGPAKAVFCALVGPLTLLVFGSAAAQDKFPSRRYEPVIVYGGSLSVLQGVPVGEVGGYAYDASSGRWRAIPLQVDEVAPGEGAFFSPDDGLLDGDPEHPDEVVFMLRDAGDQAPRESWPAGADPDCGRIEVELQDPAGGRGFVYLFRIPGGFVSPTPYSLRYDSLADEVSTRFYRVSFGNSAVIKDLAILPEGGGNGHDLVDTQKIRLKMRILYTAYEINESNDIQVRTVEVRVGPVRILRRTTCSIQALQMTFTSTSRLYPFALEMGTGRRDFPASLNISLIRQSLDLNWNAQGMRFFNARNSGIVIDGTPDNPVRTLDVPGLNWVLLTGPQGSIVSILDVPKLGDRQSLYYHDNASGGTDDGTKDTGDGKSYGDIGVKLENKISGEYDFSSTRLYLLPANQTPAVAETLLQNLLYPIERLVRSQQISRVNQPGSTAPRDYQVVTAHPNPFVEATEIALSAPLERARYVQIWDLSARCVRRITLPPGAARFTWDGKDDSGRTLPSGLYILRVYGPEGPIGNLKLLRVR
jgi:hypothetical protein